MIQAIMYFALGALSMGLIALAVTPAIWGRAMRLSRARAEAAVPLSRAEISADKDRLRAGFAVSNRKLEIDNERLNERTSSQLIEINRERDVSADLRRDKTRLEETITGLEANVDTLTTSLSETDENLKSTASDLQEREKRLEEATERISKLEGEYSESQELSEAQRLELVAQKTEIGNLGDQLQAAKTRETELRAEREKLEADLSDETERLKTARANIAALEDDRTRAENANRELTGELDRQAGETNAALLEAAAHEVSARAATSRLDELRRNAEDLAAELQLVSADRAARTEDLERRSARIAALDGDLKAEQERLAEALSRVDALERDKAAIERELKVAEKEQAEQLLALGEMRSALDEQESDRSSLLEKISGMEADSEQLTDSLKAGEQERATREAEVERLRSDLAAANDQLASATSDADASQIARLEAEDAARTRDEELKALNAELFAATRKEQELEARVVEAETALSDLKAEARASAIRNRTDSLTNGDNVRKALAAEEEKSRGLASKLAALEKDFSELRVENARLRRSAETGRKQARSDMDTRLGEIAEAVTTLGAQGDSPAGPSPVPATPPPAPRPQPAAASAQSSTSATTPGIDRASAPGAMPTIERAARTPASPRKEGGDAPPDQPRDTRTLAERLKALQRPVVDS